MRLFLSILLCGLSSACFVSRELSNAPLERARGAELVPGQTTAAEVVDQLGAPNEVVQLARRAAYRYEFDQQKRAGLWLVLVYVMNVDRRADRIWVFFDEESVLTHVGSTFEADDAEYAMPWTDVHD